MSRGLRQIIIESLRFEKPGEVANSTQAQELDWEIEAGSIWVVTGGRKAELTRLLRVLAGLEQPAGGEILISRGKDRPPDRLHESGTGVAYLPPPGDEAFTGTTVEEELLFYLENKDDLEKKLDSITEKFGFDFKSRLGRSVWELSDSQRRCLLLSSQALALPSVWVCDHPLELFDYGRCRAVAEFFQSEAKQGAAIITALTEGVQVLALARKVLIINERREVVYQGDTAGVPPDTGAGLGWNPGLYRAAKLAGRAFDVKNMLDSLD